MSSRTHESTAGRERSWGGTVHRWALAVLVAAFWGGLGLGHVTGAPGKSQSKAPIVGKGNAARARGEIDTTIGVMHGPTMRGSAVYPAQDIPLRFNHGLHLAKGMACTQCHTQIEQSRKASDLNIPTGAVCDRCHGPQHPRPIEEPARCEMCHTSVDDANRVTAGLRMPKPLLHFNHALHLERGADCSACHGDMSKVRLATTLQLPAEADCLTCHDGFGATNRCGACHPSDAGGQLVTRAQDDRVMPALVPQGASSWGAAHDLAFVEDHTGIAKANPKLCESCHSDTFCTDCHAGTVRPLRIHAGDYLTLHAMDARARTQDCQACHRTQTFCLGCHERMGFGERDQGSFGVGGSLQFHPQGWSGPPGMPQGHAHAAQRNLGACVSCHDEHSCMACHATTDVASPGLSVSPHGARFARSARCEALASRNRRVCLKCHAPGDPKLECF
jgi:hypothetical protein